MIIWPIFAQVDAVYSAIKACSGVTNVPVIVTETGWPSFGDPNEPGAQQLNAQTYNSNLIKHLVSRLGTPLQPHLPLEVYIFALFNENSKPGPSSERNYGLFKPDGSRAYDLGLVQDDIHSSPSTQNPHPSSPSNIHQIHPNNLHSSSSVTKTSNLFIGSTTIVFITLLSLPR